MKQWHENLGIGMIVFAILIMTTFLRAAEPFSPTPTPAESFDVGTIHVDEFGSGKQALVLIPGLSCGPWEWYGTIEKFSPEFSLYVITLPGFDGRAATKEKPLFTVFARDFWAMLDQRKIKNPVVIGHSLGGTLAIALAEVHSERLAGIVAVDGLPVFPMAAYATPQQREAMANQMAGMYDTLSQADMVASEKNIKSTMGTNKPELVEPTAKLEARSDPKAVAAWTREDLTSDLRPGLTKITCPFWEVMPYDPNGGSPYSQEQTVAFYKSILAGARKATVVMDSPSAHFVMLDQPEKFYKTIETCLDSVYT